MLEATIPTTKIMIAEEGVEFNTLEQICLGAVKKVTREALSELLEALDAKLAKLRDKGRFELKDVRLRRLLTLAGEVVIRRRYYQDKKSGRGVALLDEALKLEKEVRLSPGLQSTAAQLATEMSYAKAAEVLETVLKEEVSRQSIWHTVQQMGSALESQDQAVREDVFEQAKGVPHPKKRPECLFGEADGCYISLQREQHRKLELKVGAWYEGWTKRLVGREEYELAGKHYVATPWDAQTFWEQMTVAAERRYGLTNVPNVYAGGDGAKWITAGAEWIGASRMKLDTFHVHRLLSRAFGFSKEIREVVGRLLEGQEEKALAVLTRRAIEEPDEKRREEQAEAIAWVMQHHGNVKRIDYPGPCKGKLLKRQLGTMERHVNLVVAERFKKRGMSWSPEGAANLLSLRVRKLNGEWPRDWSRPEVERVETIVSQKKRMRPLPIREAGMPALGTPGFLGKKLKRMVALKNWLAG